MFNYFEDYGYDSCTARGVCSISPRMASIYEIILLYLKEFAYYSLKLQEFNIKNENVKNLILNTLSAFVSNPEIPDNIFAKVICTYSKELNSIKEQYIEACNLKEIVPEILDSEIESEKECNVIDSIRFGEQNFIKKTEAPEKHILQELLFFTAKSITIYLLELNTYSKDSNEAFLIILELLNTINTMEINNNIQSLLTNAAEEEYALLKKLDEIKTKNLGEPQNTEVSLTTTPNKAILVDGTNINELYSILKATEKHNIDIYTHGEMLSAHAYPLIKAFPNLKGHYGHGSGNSILDFSTFPGSIFIGRHSIDNIDNLYRGRLFTSDIVVPKGVSKIDDDYSELINAALESKGFKNTKKQESVKLSLDKTKLHNTINEINYENFEGICLITQSNDSYENKNYFDKLLKLLPDDILIINFSTLKNEKNNIININSGFDLNFVYETVISLKNNIDTSEKPIIAFIPKCDKHITNLILNLQTLGVKKIFMGKCPAKNINPAVVNKFCELYNIDKYGNVKDDYKTFIDYLSI